jgi:hypothetical protein
MLYSCPVDMLVVELHMRLHVRYEEAGVGPS